MKVRGMVKIAVALIVDFAILFYLVGNRTAAVVTAGIALYAWLGEYIALLKDGTISMKHLNEYEKVRLLRAKECLTGDVRRISGINISGIKLHIVPSEEINAYAYGFNNVAISRAALNACDDMTLNAVLGHEISHIICVDAVFHRIIFASVTVGILGLTLMSFVSVSIVWMIFLALCIFGVCGGVFSMLFFQGLSRFIKEIFIVLQHIVLFVYQTVMGIVSRSCEFRADKYAVELGYGPQLSYFLTRFIEGQEYRQKTLSEILYSSHPATCKRVQRIEQYNTGG